MRLYQRYSERYNLCIKLGKYVEESLLNRPNSLENLFKEIIQLSHQLHLNQAKIDQINENYKKSSHFPSTDDFQKLIQSSSEIVVHLEKHQTGLHTYLSRPENQSSNSNQNLNAMLNNLENEINHLHQIQSGMGRFAEEYRELKYLVQLMHTHFVRMIEDIKAYIQEKTLLEKQWMENSQTSLWNGISHETQPEIALAPSTQESPESWETGNPFQNLLDTNTRFIACGGSKGGTGKTSITANLAFLLAAQGKRILMIDVDLGAANLHTCLGIKYPPCSLADFLYGEKKQLTEVIISTQHPNLKFISGAKDLLELANLPFLLKLKLLNHFKKLEADYIFLDLGSGSSYNVIDFFRFTKEGIMIISPEPTAIENVSTFIKKSIYREIMTHQGIRHNSELMKMVSRLINPDDKSVTTIQQLMEILGKTNLQGYQIIRNLLDQFKIHLVLNRVRSSEDIKYMNAVIHYAERFLSLKLNYAGSIREDHRISQSIQAFMPFSLAFPNSETTLDMKKILYQIKL